MASSLEYVTYIMEQLEGLEDTDYRKMFGEYVLYYKGKVFGGIYDDRFLIKQTAAAEEMMSSLKKELPYEGGKEMVLVEEIDDAEFLEKLVVKTCELLPEPKPKKKRAPKVNGNKK